MCNIPSDDLAFTENLPRWLILGQFETGIHLTPGTLETKHLFVQNVTDTVLVYKRSGPPIVISRGFTLS